ncbi:hypothetical protein ACIQU5_11070 [Streptomyces sp. NPDC090306]|uniref:hypothetical protein n=1 Tax=unclassified Streptomyces TaxID=2593676 RepID=UPI0036E6E691
MPSAVSPPAKRSNPVLRVSRVLGTLAVVLLILVAGVWASWHNAQQVMLTKGRESGTLTVTRCADDLCTGPYTPRSVGSTARPRVVIDRSVAVRRGSTYDVIVKPGTNEVLRSGTGGVLLAWLPFGGALLLAAVLVAGGLRKSGLAKLLGLAGALLVTVTFFAL